MTQAEVRAKNRGGKTTVTDSTVNARDHSVMRYNSSVGGLT